MEERNCGGRREFLVKTTAAAGGLILALSVSGDAQTAEEVNVKIDPAGNLGKVGGSQVIETKSSGKIVVVRTAEFTFKAYSTKCTHSGGPLKFDSENMKFVCGWHGSEFDADGKKLKGPGKKDLTPYSCQNALVVSVVK